MVQIMLLLSSPHYWFAKSSITCPLFFLVKSCCCQIVPHSPHPYRCMPKKTKTTTTNQTNLFVLSTVLGRKWRSSCSVWHLCPEITPISVHSDCNCSPLSHHHCSAGHCSRLPTVLSMLRFALSLSILLHWSQSELSAEQILFLHPPLILSFSPFCS